MGEGAGESDKPGQEKATPKQTESEKMVPDKNDPKQKVKGKGQQEKADHTDGKQRGRANKGKENDKKGCQKKESNGDEESSSKQDAKARDDKKSEDGKTTQSDEKKSENKPAASVTEKVQDEGSEKQSSKAKSKKEKKATQSDEKKSEDKPAASSTEREEDEGAEKQSSKAKSKKEKKDRAGKTESPPPPSLPTDTRRPNLLMPVRAEVLQMEHAIETPYDPRPNAFVDSEHGICRVYHGPAYGNPYGTLYPRRLYPGHQQQIGVPHPLPNPWLQGPLAIGEQENMNKASQEAAAASTGATTANPWEAYHRHALAAQALGLGLMVPGYPNVGMWPGALQQDLPASYSFSGAGGTGANQIPPAGQLPFKSWHPGWPYAWAGQDPGDSKKPEENKGTETEKQGNKDKEVKDKAEVSAPSPDKEQGWVTNIGPGAWPSPGTKEATGKIDPHTTVVS